MSATDPWQTTGAAAPSALFTVDDVDARIASVQTTLDRMGQSLFDLDNDPMRQVLDSSPLTGATKAAWDGAAARIAGLWQANLALSDVMAEVTRLRGTKHKLSDTQRSALAERLTGPSVQLAPPGFDNGPYGPTSIDETVRRMGVVFEALATLVAQVGTVWNEVAPELDDLDRRLDSAESSVRDAGVRAPTEVAVCRTQLRALRDRMGSDPIAVHPDDLTGIADGVRRAEEQARAAGDSRRTLGDRLSTATSQLEQANALLQEAGTTATEAAAKVSDPGGMIAGVQRDLGTLARGLARLRAELRAIGEVARTDWQEADRQLNQLGGRPGQLLADATRLHRAAAAPLETRGELRGRLEAYRARAGTTGRAEDLQLEAVYQEAYDALYVAPCDVDRAERLVSRYQEGVRARREEDK